MKSAADSIYAPNRFELLNCETTENDKNDLPYHKDNSSPIDLFLTNKLNFFQKINVIETGLSDHHKFICTFLNLVSKSLNQRLFAIETTKNLMRPDGPKENYDFLTNTFINTANKHVPLKKKFIRENQAPSITRNFRKEIYTTSRFRNKYCESLLKKMKNSIKNRKTNVLPLGGNV